MPFNWSILGPILFIINFVGVIIDSKPSWSQHIKQLKTKISKNVGVMIKLKSSIQKKSAKKATEYLIKSH